MPGELPLREGVGAAEVAPKPKNPSATSSWVGKLKGPEEWWLEGRSPKPEDSAAAAAKLKGCCEEGGGASEAAVGCDEGGWGSEAAVGCAEPRKDCADETPKLPAE